MNYNKQDLHVKDFLMVPKYFSLQRLSKRENLYRIRQEGQVG